MAEVGRNTNKAYDNGYVAGFHFGIDMQANPYNRDYMRKAWIAGWLKGREDKIKSKRIVEDLNV